MFGSKVNPESEVNPEGEDEQGSRPKSKLRTAVIALIVAALIGIPGGILGFSYYDLSQAQAQATGHIEYEQRSTQSPSDIVTCTSERADVEVTGDVDVTKVGTQELPVRITEGVFSRESTVDVLVKDTQPPQITLKSSALTVTIGNKPKAADVVKSVSDPVDGELEEAKEEPKASGSKVGEEVFYDKGWYLVKMPQSTDKTGSYTINVAACDKHGNKVTQDVSLKVVDPLEGVELTAKTDTLEYSKKTVDPLTLVTCSDPDAKIEASELDLSTVGEKKVTYKLSKDKSTREVTCKFTIRDTKNPVIELDQTACVIDKGADFDPYANVKSVNDEVDGALARADAEPTDNGDGWYTVNGDYDVNSPSKYFFTVVACDKNGNRVQKEFSLEVKEPPASEETQTAPAANERDYVLNTNTRRFHYPSCGDVNRIYPEHRRDVHMSRDEVVSMGYSSCGHCHP